MNGTCLIRAFLAMGTVSALRLAAVEMKELNLIEHSSFKPVEMHGRVSAAYGWGMTDRARLKVGNFRDGKYLSGEGLFDVQVKDGVLTISFPEKLHPGYKKNGIELSTIIHGTMMRGKFRVHALVKVERGELVIGNHPVKNSPEWQELDFVSERAVSDLTYQPVANGGFSISHLSVYPEYPKLGGEINLPDGGKLTKLLLPKDAKQPMRWCVALWQNLLWRLTGTALPVEVVDEVKPTPGAFAAVKGETAPGGWQLKVDKDGIVFTYGDELCFWPAVADYMRDLGHTIYARDMPVVITADPKFALKAVDKKIKPRYRYCSSGAYAVGMVDPKVLGARNLVDYYHLPKPVSGHNVNIMMPVEIYHKDHPEYYAMNKKGERPIERYIPQQSPCLSNPDAFEITYRNFIRYAHNVPGRHSYAYTIGDAQSKCLCKDCRRINGGSEDYSTLMMMFANRAAKELRKTIPDARVLFSAYVNTMVPPLAVKPEPNIDVSYCLIYHRLPCSLHQDCELNRVGFDEIKTWSKYIGREKLGVSTYRDIRPLHTVERLKMLQPYVGQRFFSWIYMGFSPAVPFVTTRWNYGEDDVEALLEEFNDHYYGKAGKFVTEVNRIVEEYAKNYKHTPEELDRYRHGVHQHIGIRCGSPISKPVLDRETLDKLYAIFDKGLAAIGDSDKIARQHTLEEKASYILEDLNRYRLSSCRTDEDLAKYAVRVAELVRIAREVPPLQKRLLKLKRCEDMFTMYTGITIKPSGKAWCFTPEVEEFMKDPIKALSGAPVSVPGGLRFAPRVMKGGSGPVNYSYQCPPRIKNSINRASSGRSEITINFKLQQDMPESSVLVLTGLDDDKPGTSRFAVEVNGKRIFEGPNTFPEHDWGGMSIPIPGGSFKKDLNVIKIVNTTREDSEYRYAGDFRWGWVAFSDAILYMPNSGFKTFLKGGKDHGGWYQARMNPFVPLGKIKVEDGKLHLAGDGSEMTGVAFFRSHRYPKIAATSLGKVKFSVTAFGEGELVVDCIVYGPKRILGRRDMTRSFKLSSEPQTFSCELDVPEKGLSFIPEIAVKGEGRAVVSAIDMDFKMKTLEDTKK